MDQADVIFYAEPEELYAHEPPVRKNAPRRKKTLELPVLASEEYEALLVRTALVRSASYREGKFLPSLRSPQDVLRLLAHLTNANQEHFVTIPVNNAMVPLAVHETGIGPSGFAAISAVDVMRVALLTGGQAVFVAHNHPGGDPRPSEDDWKMLKTLRASFDCNGMSVIDSFIVGYDGWYSMDSRTRGFWSEVVL